MYPALNQIINNDSINELKTLP
ncbi:MAG: hypothetical protein RLZZ422_2073, partial [Pseudomonadota bacterium]